MKTTFWANSSTKTNVGTNALLEIDPTGLTDEEDRSTFDANVAAV